MNTGTPAVSVVLPANSARYLAAAIESILNQTEDEFELLIVDDASEDGVAAMAEGYGDRRIRTIRHDKPHGLPSSLNEGIAESKAPLIARMDADDIAHPSRLARQATFLGLNPSVGVVGSFVETFGAKNERWLFHTGHDEIQAALLFDCALAHPTVMARSQLLRDNHYDESLAIGEDYDLWSRLVQQGIRFHVLPEYLLRYRVHENQITSNRTSSLRKRGDAVRVAWLARLGIDPTPEELQLHASIAATNWIPAKGLWDSIFVWTERLLSANRERRVFDPYALANVIFQKRLFAAYQLRREGLLPARKLYSLFLSEPRFLVDSLLWKRIWNRLGSRKGGEV